ncbi:MAG: cytochrome P450 [Candidatus Acidiferrales bacterium]
MTKHAAAKRKHPRPPGPKGKFLLGHFREVVHSSNRFLERCSREYGDVVRLRVFHVPVCLLANPADIESVLSKNSANFLKARDYRAMKAVLGEGLLTSEGSFWQKQRKLMQPAFRHENITTYAETMVSATSRMLDTWRNGETRDVHAEFMAVTLEIVTKVLFGSVVPGDAATVAKSLTIMMEDFNRQGALAFLLPESVPIPTFFRLKRAIETVDAMIYKLIDARRTDRRAARNRNGAPSGHDLLETLLSAQDEAGSEMTSEQVRDEVMTLFLAGHETTANALSWTWYLLAQHPEVAKKLAAEIDSVLEGRVPTAADAGRLPYTEKVIKESMRVYPPVWAIGRQSIKPFEVSAYHLPAKTNVVILQWTVHRDPRFWTDPEVFDPERWSPSGARYRVLPRFAYFPFGGGPRVCIGAGFAMMEAILLLATVAQRFEMKLAPHQKVRMLPSVTLRPRRGIKMILKEHVG